jgi:hypothetical protein
VVKLPRSANEAEVTAEGLVQFPGSKSFKLPGEDTGERVQKHRKSLLCWRKVNVAAAGYRPLKLLLKYLNLRLATKHLCSARTSLKVQSGVISQSPNVMIGGRRRFHLLQRSKDSGKDLYTAAANQLSG